mgnify:CR=1 FL=1
MPAPVIQLEGLGKSFPGRKRPALGGISASIHPGRVTGLVGPDGAGKTTLLRLMAGLLTPSEGRVAVKGLDPAKDAARLAPVIGYMPQKFGLYEDLTVGENLALHADLRGVTGPARQESFDRLLAFTDLSRFTSRLAGRLSGGMKQKLGLACALLGQPEVLLHAQSSAAPFYLRAGYSVEGDPFEEAGIPHLAMRKRL